MTLDSGASRLLLLTIEKKVNVLNTNTYKSEVLAFRVTKDRADLVERFRNAKSKELGRDISLSEAVQLALEDRHEAVHDATTLSELRQNPTTGLWHIRHKIRLGEKLSSAEWIFLIDYVRLGIDADRQSPPTSNLVIPSTESVQLAIAALRSLYKSKSDPSAELQFQLYSLLGGKVEYDDPLPVGSKKEVILTLIEKAIEPFRDPHGEIHFPLIGAALLLLTEDMRSSSEDIHPFLAPFCPALWKLAARGHFIRHGEPIRTSQSAKPALANDLYFSSEQHVGLHALLAKYELALEVELGTDEVPVSVSMRIDKYPLIVALRRAVEGFDGKTQWLSRYFHVRQNTEGDRVELLDIEARTCLCFSREQWADLREFMNQVWANDLVKHRASELEQQYGEQG